MQQSSFIGLMIGLHMGSVNREDHGDRRSPFHPYFARSEMNQGSKTSIVNKAGFTLTELMATVAIVGVLSTVALPNYLRSVNKARQAEVANQISQLTISIQSYREEYLRNPSGWGDLAEITAIPTNTGVVTSGSSFSPDLKSPNGGFYSISITANGDEYSITGTPVDSTQGKWDINACLNTDNGASALERGSGQAPAEKANCGGTT